VKESVHPAEPAHKKVLNNPPANDAVSIATTIMPQTDLEILIKPAKAAYTALKSKNTTAKKAVKNVKFVIKK